MEIITVLTCVFLSVILFRKIFGLIWLWWRKEYRFDRMLIHLGTKQGISTVIGKTDAALILLLMLWTIPSIRTVVSIMLFIYIGSMAIVHITRLKSWFLPPRSPKVVVLFVLSVLTVLALSVYIRPPYIALAIASVILFPISALLVMMLGLPTKIYHAYVIRAAVGILRDHTPLTVIGVTGSYGKTSVKEYLSTIISTSYPTLKTQLSKNSPIGIAEVVRSSLKPADRVFVVEMGAYKPGEIAYMSDMVRPEIAIITAINPQHQDLFGSIEQTVRAKYELVEHLTGRKIVIINADNTFTRKMGMRAAKEGCDVYWWTVDVPDRYLGGQPKQHVYRAKNIQSGSNGIAFDCVVGAETVRVKADVIGSHQAGNIMAAIIGARLCGLSLKQAANAASLIRPAQKVMQLRNGWGGSIFIDDTFNNNPDAAVAAIRFLESYTGKKYMVFQPMIELGSYAEQSHRLVGKVAGEICDAILMTNGNHLESFTEGVHSSRTSVPVSVKTAQSSAVFLKSVLKPGDIVLFKGKDAEHVLSLLLK